MLKVPIRQRIFCHRKIRYNENNVSKNESNNKEDNREDIIKSFILNKNLKLEAPAEEEFNHRISDFGNKKVYNFYKEMFEKYNQILENENLFEEYKIEGARLVITAFGSIGRIAKAAVKKARILFVQQSIILKQA